jgi:hypothetical protein
MTDRSRDPQGLLRQEQRSAEGLGEYREVIRQGTSRIVEKAVGILEEIDHAAALLGELLTESARDRRRLLREQPRFCAIMLCELLLARSREAWFTDPAAAVELAELAVLVSDRLDTEHDPGPFSETRCASPRTCGGRREHSKPPRSTTVQRARMPIQERRS